MLSVVLYSVKGGIETYTLQLANALCKYANVAYAIDIQKKKDLVNFIDDKVTLINYRRPRVRDPRGAVEMYRLSKKIKKFNADIFHLQSDGIWECVLLRYLNGMTIVNTVHDPIKHIDQRNFLNNWTMKDAIQRSVGWVVHSEGLRSLFMEKNYVNGDKILVHPHGVYDYYVNYTKPRINRDKYILFFGAIRTNKGLDLLLKAFDKLKHKAPEWRVVVAGRGQLRKKIDLFSRKKYQTTIDTGNIEDVTQYCEQIGDRIELHNQYIPDPEASELFANAGIVVLPYRHGSQSGVLAIAAAFGCPVLATMVGSIPEILTDKKNALLVEPENPSALFKGLSSLTNNSNLRESLGANLYKLAYDKWSWEKIAQKTLKFYKKLI